MVRSAAATFAFITIVTTALSAQGQGRHNTRNQGIPPGQMPPAGQCRVWYEGVPPGRQPRATSCREAERVASRDRNARVIYGSSTSGWETRDRRTDERWPRDSRSDRRFDREGYDRGYRDGVTKAQEDVRDNDRYDPARHGWYKSADRGYESRDGAKDDYRAAYRAGFVEGYDNAYRPNRNTRNTGDGLGVFERIFER